MSESATRFRNMLRGMADVYYEGGDPFAPEWLLSHAITAKESRELKWAIAEGINMLLISHLTYPDKEHCGEEI